MLKNNNKHNEQNKKMYIANKLSLKVGMNELFKFTYVGGYQVTKLAMIALYFW